MRQLWAPWRMEYIDSGDRKVDSCIFCVKASEDRDAENYVLYRSAFCFVMMNLYPYNNGHLMVAPYQHMPDIEALSPDVLADIMTTTQRCLSALRGAMAPHGFNMGINQGAVAGAGITDHVHMHIVPRWNGDTNFMPVLADVKVMPQHLTKTYKSIRKFLSQ